MAEVCSATGAEHFGAHHPAGDICVGADVECGYRGIEAGPACARIEFCCRVEQVGAAAGTGVYAQLF